MTRDQLLAALRENKDKIDQAYWIFTRTAKGKPPPAHLYEERKRLKEELRQTRE